LSTLERIISKEFKKAVTDDLKDEDLRKVVEAEASEMRESRWDRRLGELLEKLGRNRSDLASARKGEGWKVALARRLREDYLVPYAWIAENLHMGKATSVQSQVSRCRRKSLNKDHEWNLIKS